MGNVIRLNTSTIGSAINKISGDVSNAQTAKNKVSSATFKIKWDDFFSLENYSRKLYSGLDESIRDLNKLNNRMESIVSSSKAAVNSFSDIDNGVKTNGAKKKKKNWNKIFKKIGIYSSIMPVGTIIGGVAGYVVSREVADRIAGRVDAKSSSDSITIIKRSSSVDQKKIGAKGKSVDSNYGSMKNEYDKFMEKQLFGKETSRTDNGDYILKSIGKINLEDKSTWDQRAGLTDGCPQYCVAAYRNMTEGTNFNYNDFNSSTYAGVDTTDKATGHDAVLSMALERLRQGKPSIVKVDYSGADPRWGHKVVITGLKQEAVSKISKGEPLDTSDFLIYDPWGGDIKELSNAGGHTDITCDWLIGND